MFNPVVQLKSGGYIVIDPTEALISIDVNSGRATREHSIEDTALKTNLEAAEEAARQFRLRDLAGLIVIDFIDMEEHRNNRAVERKLKESLKGDRARIQVGRISMFGLLEMSRQRMRAGLHESGTIVCPHCLGIGRIRSLETTVLNCLRMIEEEGMKARTATATLKVPTETGLYLLNNKRGELHRMEEQYALHVVIDLTPSMGPMESELVRGLSLSKEQSETVETAIRFDGEYAVDEYEDEDDDISESEVDLESDVEVVTKEAEAETTTADRPKQRRSRQRSRGGRNKETKDEATPSAAKSDDADGSDTTTAEDTANGDGSDGDEDRKPRRRRRGRRGGRRNRKTGEDGDTGESDELVARSETDDQPADPSKDPVEPEPGIVVTEEDVADPVVIEIRETAPVEVSPEPVVKPSIPEASNDDIELVDATGDTSSTVEKKSKPSKRGWWQRGA